MFDYSPTDVDWECTISLARLRTKTFKKSTLQSNFLGGCAELTFKTWALGIPESQPVLVRYWYPWLTGTADLYVGRPARGVDVKAHQHGGELLYPCHQASKFKDKAIDVVVWAAAIADGPVDYELGIPRNVKIRLIGWSTAEQVAGAPPKTLANNDRVHVVAEESISTLDQLREFLR